MKFGSVSLKKALNPHFFTIIDANLFFIHLSIHTPIDPDTHTHTYTHTHSHTHTLTHRHTLTLTRTLTLLSQQTIDCGWPVFRRPL